MATDDYFVKTTNLQGIFSYSQGDRSWRGVMFPPNTPPITAREASPILTEALLPDVRRSNRRLVHVEAGTTIKQLYEALDNPSTAVDPIPRDRWTLPTMGGASGQTIAGAISTGTHGGDFNQPPIADMVRAIHLIDSEGNLHWIERGGSGAITDPAAVAATWVADEEHIHQDDDWFRSVLVSLGNFGVIYGYIIEVQAQFGISEFNYETTWADIKPSLASGGSVREY